MDFDSTERLALKNYLEHHGVKGQKWGVRRFEDEKGSSRRTSPVNIGANVGRSVSGSSPMRNIGNNITKNASVASAPKVTNRKEIVNNIGSNITKSAIAASQPKFAGRNSNRSNNLVSNLVARGAVSNAAKSSANGAKSASIIGNKSSGVKDVVDKSTQLRNQLISNRKVEKANKYIKKLMANTADTLYDTPREKGQRMISEKLSAAANIGQLNDEEKAQAFVAEMADNMIKLLTTGDDDKVEDELNKLIKDAAKKFSPTPEEKKEKISEMLSKMPGKKR